MNKNEFDEAVAWTEEELKLTFRVLASIDATLPTSDAKVLRILEELDTFARSDLSWAADADGHKEAFPESMMRAWRKGLAPDAAHQARLPPYIGCLKYFLALALNAADYFDALRLHAARFMDRGDPLPFELQKFVTDVLKDKIVRPTRRGRPALGEARNIVLHALIVEVCERYNVKGMRERAWPDPRSACDIVAVAMWRQSRSPAEYDRIEKIFLAGNRAGYKQYCC